MKENENDSVARGEQRNNVPHQSRLHFLQEIESKIQKEWDDAKVFEYDASEQGEPKYLATFYLSYSHQPTPLRQVFTITKADFAVGYHRLKGYRAMSPFVLQCPTNVKLHTEVLKSEITEFGCPPNFPEGRRYRRVWNYMRDVGVKEEDIPKLTDPEYYISYFARAHMDKLKKLGLGVDWRRAFTTGFNPFYESFVSWQLRTMKERGKIKKGQRYAVWSPLMGSHCSDQNRQRGEGIAPQYSSLIKLKVTRPFPECLKTLEQSQVFLVAPTLFPETLYGQTNCWVHPEGEYVAVSAQNNDVYICSEYAAKTLSYQRLLKENRKFDVLLRVTGNQLVGTAVHAPLSVYDIVFTLPLFTLELSKGTGIEISVPSLSPKYYATLRDLQKRQSIDPKWVAYEPVSVVATPRLGDLAAVYACQRFKVTSPDKSAAMINATSFVYDEVARDCARMEIGTYKGDRLPNARNSITRDLIKSGEALEFAYLPQKVVSRLGDECVAAIEDHWYLDHGDLDWKNQANQYLEKIETFDGNISKHNIAHHIEFAHGTSCSRSAGVGCKIPWDPRRYVTPLAEVSLFPVYSTVAHILQGDLNTENLSTKITPDQLTHEVWEYILQNGPNPENSQIPKEVLDRLKSEFNYWFPVDLHVASKDMIHHICSVIFSNCAVFPPEKRPKAIRINGVVNDPQKMTAREADPAFDSELSADALRLSLAELGDAQNDSFFNSYTVEANTLRLTTLIQWIEKDILGSLEKLRTGPIFSFADKVFESTINKLIQETDVHYSKTQFHKAMRTGVHEFQHARDHYRKRVGQSYHRDLILRFIEVQTTHILPICPHFAEYVWKLLNKEGFAVRDARWPQAGAVDAGVLAQDAYIERLCAEQKKKAMKSKPTRATIFVTQEFPEWHRKTVEFLKSVYDKDKNSFISDNEIVQHVKQNKDLQRLMGKVMPLVSELKKQVAVKGYDALNLQLSFDEKALLESQIPYIRNALEIENVDVKVEDPGNPKTDATPGNPVLVFVKSGEKE